MTTNIIRIYHILKICIKRYHYVGIDGTEFSLALASDESWNYLVVPEEQGLVHETCLFHDRVILVVEYLGLLT